MLDKLDKLTVGARFSTICLHAGQEPDPSTGAIITPIYQTSTYVQEELGRHKGYEYGRTQNPTRMALERNLAAIEAGKAGFAFASGMAAIGAIATMLKSGDHVVVSDNTYGGTFRLFDKVLTRYDLSFTYVDTSKLDEVERAIKPTTRMLFVETPTNPVMRITDLRAAADLAHHHNARLVVDNTFASPYIQRPIEFGADLVTHSTTKYLNGHSDSIGGIVIAVRDDDIDWLRFIQNAEGAILGPDDHTEATRIRISRSDVEECWRTEATGCVLGAHDSALDRRDPPDHPSGALPPDRARTRRVPRLCDRGPALCHRDCNSSRQKKSKQKRNDGTEDTDDRARNVLRTGVQPPLTRVGHRQLPPAVPTVVAASWPQAPSISRPRVSRTVTGIP